MSTQSVSKRLFRLFAAMIVFAMVLSLFTPNNASAQGGTPPRKEKVQRPVDLSGVKAYYKGLGRSSGIMGVVVELKSTAAALVYAKSDQVLSSDANVDTEQVNLIEREQNTFMSDLNASGIQATELFRTQKAYNGIWMRVDAADLETLAGLPGVKAIHPIVSKVVDHTTSVPLIGALQVWGGSGTYQGTGIKVGIIDTGVDYIHTNFGGTGTYPTTPDYTVLGGIFPTAKVVGGWDFAGDAYNADPASASYNPIPAPDANPMDCNGHGSHVAGTVAGFGVNADGSTYVEKGAADTYAKLKDLTSADYVAKFRIGPGVAPKASLYALRVFGCEGSTDLTEMAIEWAMDPNGDGNLSDHLDVINMSLGSSFGSAEYDTSAIASNNAAAAGVIVVASAGNSNDVYYITGTPAAARNAISVASSVDAGAVVGAFEVTATTASGAVLPVGKYAAAGAGFGPQTYATTGDLLQKSATDIGCLVSGASPYTAGFFTGKIALINRGTCTFVEKVKNAQDAGAIGVLVANNVDTAPADMGGTSSTITIPSMITTKAIGASLRTDMAKAPVTIKLTNANAGTFFLSLPAYEDTVSTFSSRGPARGGTLLKPDISAPGETIFSTANGSGNKGASFNGTSMASPHVAGVMALLKQIHPTWSVAELKALVMNTASNDLWTSSAHTAKYTPTRVGAGRVSVSNAALSSVIAYNADDPGAVSLSFGEQAVLGTQSFVKSITIKNTGAAAASYNAAFNQYYQANAGLTFTLLSASNAALSNPVTVPAGGTLTIKVKIDADAAALTRARDASIATTNGRQRFSEGGGYVTLTSTGTDPKVRVPVHIAARPASAMSVSETSLVLPAAATGTLNLHPGGIPVDTVDDTSLVSIMSLLRTSPNDPYTDTAKDYADLHYIGVTSDYPTYPFTDANPLNPVAEMYFGFATYGKWDTPNSVEFDVYIDQNEDGVYDYVVFNYNLALLTGTTDDVQITGYCTLPDWDPCDFDNYTNGLSGTYNTNLFNNNVMVLPVNLKSIGLSAANTNFNFYVKSYAYDGVGPMDGGIDDVMSYDVAHQAFTAVDTVNTGMPMWYDASVYSPTFDVKYDKASIATEKTEGLLLLHHHNDAANSAEALYFPMFTISGNVGAPGATLSYMVGSEPKAVTADESGYYSFEVPSGWTGRVTPSMENFSFEPMYTDYTNVTINQVRQDYFATETLFAEFTSVAANDGWVLGSKKGSSLDSKHNIIVGDSADNKQYRGFLHFDTSTLPDDAVVTSVTLNVKKAGQAGKPGVLGKLLVDIKTGSFGTPKLTLGDFQALSSNGKTLIGNLMPAPDKWYTVTLADFGETFVNTTGSTQFRLRFAKSTANAGHPDYLQFFSGNGYTELWPTLLVQYYIP
jgi:subtilisin family serine protease